MASRVGESLILRTYPYREADLIVTIHDERRPFCFGLDELLAWLDGQQVHDQTWTSLGEKTWRLDGYAY